MRKNSWQFLYTFCSCVSVFGFIPDITADEKNITLGITQKNGDICNTEFVKYNKLYEFYKTSGIDAGLISLEKFTQKNIDVDRLKKELFKYNVVTLSPDEEASFHLTPELAKRAENVSEALSEYVAAGGGLLIQPRPVRYANDDDEKYWNIVFKKFDMELLHEGVCDKATLFNNELKHGRTAEFFTTGNIKQHAITTDINKLIFPVKSFYANAGTPAVKYSPEWQIIVSGNKTAKSYISDPLQNLLNLEQEGFYKSEPPVVAIRQYGKGRIVCIAIDKLFTGMNYMNLFWSGIVENSGSMKLMTQAVKWLSESNIKNKDFGSYMPSEYKLVNFKENCNWDNALLPSAKVEPVKGIIGAHTSYSDGTGSVEDYVKAAKKAGLSFIVFAEPLEMLSADKLNALKSDCAKFSDDKFYACPGIEFSDKAGIRWFACGEKIVWPGNTVFRKGSYNGSYTLWDGKVINHYGQYIELCNYCTTAVINYDELREKGAVPENMWWFFNVIPYAYDKGKLTADNFSDWLFSLRDLRLVSPLSFTRIKTPAEVASAASLSSTGMKTLKDAVNNLNTRFTPYWKAKDAVQFTTYGNAVEVLSWGAVNDQMEENFYSTKGAQRVKVKFSVKSPAGIKDVKVYDADYGILRHFISENNEKTFTREFELVHDKQHYLTLLVEDVNGKKAISSSIFLYCYKQGLYRCGDNLNILGPLGMYWHPDRNQMFHLVKDFRNAELFSVQGWDRGGPDCPVPNGNLMDTINIKGIGKYPAESSDSMLGKRMNVQLAGHNIQIAEMKMDTIVEKFDNQQRPGPSFATIARKISGNEYFERIDRMIAPMDRMNHFTAWNHRRLYESLTGYKGSFLWHEGEIKFKKDVVLSGNVPIPLAWTDEPLNIKKNWGTSLIAKDAAKGDLKIELKDEKNKISSTGRIAPGGYAAHMNFPVGYIGILVPEGMDFAYASSLPGRLIIGIGKNGQEIKAGTVLKYAFLAGDFIDQNNSSERMEYISKAFNMAGGKNGYPIDVNVGSLLNAVFFFSVQAEKMEAVFTLGPKKDIGIDLPVRVKGIEDNGCAATYTTYRKWFRFVAVSENTAYFQEPIDEKNEIWVGNVFVSDNKNIKMTLVVDGQSANKKTFLEIHNPTDKAVTAKISSPAHTPVFGGMSLKIELAPGSSVIKELTPDKMNK